MSRYAVVRTADSVVVNVIVLSQGAEWTPPEGHELVPAETAGSPGDTWDEQEETFTRPAPPAEYPAPEIVASAATTYAQAVQRWRERKVRLGDTEAGGISLGGTRQ